MLLAVKILELDFSFLSFLIDNIKNVSIGRDGVRGYKNKVLQFVFFKL